jgi:hypothetical protein
MNRLFRDALKFLDDNEPLWGEAVDRRGYLSELIGHLADKALAEQYRRELAALTDDQLKEQQTCPM